MEKPLKFEAESTTHTRTGTVSITEVEERIFVSVRNDQALSYSVTHMTHDQFKDLIRYWVAALNIEIGDSNG